MQRFIQILRKRNNTTERVGNTLLFTVEIVPTEKCSKVSFKHFCDGKELTCIHKLFQKHAATFKK